jgi:nucleoside-diphosphate-sugar epimerase
MKVFVAGATGAIGRQLLPMLLEAGHDVVGTTRKEAGAELVRQWGARPIVVDVYDRDKLVQIMQAERPDVVIDILTALQERDFAANDRLRVEGTPNLVDAALAAGVRRMIGESLAFAYVPGDTPATEDEPLDVDAPPPRGPMAQGVRALEEHVGRVPEHVVLRFGTLYGPGTWRAPGEWVAEQVRRGEMAATDGVTSFLHVADAARATLLALDWPSTTLNIVDDEPAPGTEWLPFYAEVLGAPPPPVKHGKARGERGASNARARREVGWQPLYPSWREGLRQALG